jgi:hypothetical protein
LADTYRLQGELLLQKAIPAAAQVGACSQQALSIANRQHAKDRELLGHQPGTTVAARRM